MTTAFATARPAMNTAPTGSKTIGPGPRVRVPVNLDIAAIKPQHLKMLLILECYCGDKSYCWPSNKTLALKYGCKVRQVKEILREMQEAGYLWRVAVEPDRFRDGSGR